MPKIVDHEQRRQELAAALWRVIVAGGARAVSVRNVAAAAGCSPGALRHYFVSQDDLLAFALDRIRVQIGARLRARLAATEGLDPVEAAAGIAEVLLPLDEERLAEVTVWMAFSVRAWESSGLEELRDDGWRGSAYIARLTVSTALGSAPPEDQGRQLVVTEHEQFARLLQVAIDGWCLQLLFYPAHVTARGVERELRAEITRWITSQGGNA